LKCTCGKLVKDCFVWEDIVKKYSIKKVTTSERNYLKFFALLPNKIITKEFEKDDYVEILNNIYEKYNCEYIIDNSKSLSYLIRLNQSKKIDLYVVYIIRDLNGVIYSNSKTSNKNFLLEILEWYYKNVSIYKYLRQEKLNFKTIYYSKFCENSNYHINKVEKWLNIKVNKDYIFEINNTVHHDIGGNDMRFRKFEGIKEDVKWKKKLPLIKKLVIKIFQIILPLNKRINYF